MRGTISNVNTAMAKPLLYTGVERSLLMANAMICFPMIAATYLQLPACLFGFALFALNHILLTQLSQHDPIFASIIKRYTRYCMQHYFPARSHPSQTKAWPTETVVRPR